MENLQGQQCEIRKNLRGGVQPSLLQQLFCLLCLTPVQMLRVRDLLNELRDYRRALPQREALQHVLPRYEYHRVVFLRGARPHDRGPELPLVLRKTLRLRRLIRQ